MEKLFFVHFTPTAPTHLFPEFMERFQVQLPEGATTPSGYATVQALVCTQVSEGPAGLLRLHLEQGNPPPAFFVHPAHVLAIEEATGSRRPTGFVPAT